MDFGVATHFPVPLASAMTSPDGLQKMTQPRIRSPEIAVFCVALLLFVAYFACVWVVARKTGTQQQNECVIVLTDMLEKNQLNGVPVEEIKDCLSFATSSNRLPNGEVEYQFDNHPTRANQEGTASFRVTVDSQGKSVKKSELLFYDW